MRQREILVAGLKDMIRSGRLTEHDIPEDFDWLLSTIERPDREAVRGQSRSPRRLDARRRAIAKQLFEDHTFGSPVVDVGGWEIDGSYWKRGVFLKVSDNAPTLRVWYHIEFQFGESAVASTGCNVDL